MTRPSGFASIRITRDDEAKKSVEKKQAYTCGSCLLSLGKGTRTKPSIWCNVCGWIHFHCSGLIRAADYAKSAGNFLCTKCSKTRRLVPSTDDAVAHSKLHTIYTSCQSPASYGSRASLKKYSNCTYKQVDNYLRKSETYSKFKQTKKKFVRLKVQTYRLNEIWSVDLADMQQLARQNSGVKFLFVAVDTLSRFLWVRTLIRKTAEACKNALREIITDIRNATPNMQPIFCRKTKGIAGMPPKPEKIWVDKGREFAGEFSSFCEQEAIELYSTNSETKSAFAERNIRSLKAIIFKYLHENCTDKYIDSLQHFVYIINSRVNRVTKLAPNQVKKTDEASLITLQNCNTLQKPKFKVGQHVRIRRKIDLFHRGYRIQFTEEVFQIVAIETLNPPTYALKDSNEQLIRGKFYENELVRFEPDLS